MHSTVDSERGSNPTKVAIDQISSQVARSHAHSYMSAQSSLATLWEQGLLPRHALLVTPILFIESLTSIAPSSFLPTLLGDFFHSDSTAEWVDGITDSIGGFIAMLLAPSFGVWSDKHGRKGVLLAVSVASMLSTMCLSLWPYLTLWAYIGTRSLSRISVAGILYAAISDASSRMERSSDYSRVTGWSTLAMVAGPMLSLIFDAKWTFRITGLLCIFNLIYIAFFMPETVIPSPNDPRAQTSCSLESSIVEPSVAHFHERQLQAPSIASSDSLTFASEPLMAAHMDTQRCKDDHEPNSRHCVLNPFRLIWQGIRSPVHGRLTIILFFSQASTNGIHSCAKFFLKHHLNYTPDQNSWLLFAMGVWATVLMVFIVPRAIHRRFSLRTIILVGLLADALHQSSYLYVPSFQYFPVIAFFQGLSFISYPAASSAISHGAQEHEQGFVLAIAGGVVSLAKSVGPLAFNGVLSYFSSEHAVFRFDGAPFVLGFVCITIAFALTMQLRVEQVEEIPESQSTPNVVACV